MNEPIISPWLIYWIGRLNMIYGFSCVLGILLTLFTIIIGITAVKNNDNSDDFKKFLKKLVCVALFFDTLALFVPTKTEAIAMYVAKNITPASIKATGEFADKAVDKLIEKILKVSETAKEKQQ